MAEGNSAAINVHAGPIPVKFLAVRQSLRSESLIYLNQVKIVDLQANALQQAIDGASGSREDVAGHDGG